jgi:aminoglycoside phosphotransferase family enzyme/predicted kinase
VSTAPPRTSVADAMSRSGFYPGEPPVDVCETHTAWVFLAGDRAFKVKKPVRMDFLDFSTLERRHAACAEEVRVNAELAPSLDMALRAIVPRAGSYAIDEPGAAEAVEYAIEMRRFDEARTMAALVERGELAEDDVRAVARRIAGFHAGAARCTPADPVGDVRRTCDENFCELFAIAGDELAGRVLAAERFAGAFLLAHRDELAARAAAGRIRDGHGDLRAEHVVLEQPLAIVDRLEFDAALRAIDVADDLAFLVMDLQRLGAGDAARLLVQAYRDCGGDPGSDALLAFYGVYRALVRAKVALLRAAQQEDPAAAAAARDDADDLIALAERFAWTARGPLVLAVGGPPASGKSTLAAALGRRSGWPVLSSDLTRKRRHGVARSERAPDDAYTSQARAEIYRELGELAGAPRAQAGVIVDATFGDPALRAAFLDGLGDRTALRALECHAPAATRARRARGRLHDQHGSDADADVAARLGASHSGWDELPDEAILLLRSGVAADRLVDQVADWLDTGAVARSAEQRRL